MNQCVLRILTLVIVSARCCAESIPALSETSDIAVAHITQADELNQKIRVNDKATVVSSEERVFPIESIMSSIEITAESIPRTLYEANTMDVSEVKDRNPALATQMEKLGININGVIGLAEVLKSTNPFKLFSNSNLKWMVLGKVYFEKVGTSIVYREMVARILLKETNIKITNDEALLKWTTKVSKDLGLKSKIIFGKMSWLIRSQNEFILHFEDAAKMAFGSEYLTKKVLPFSDRILEIMSGHDAIDEGVYEHLLRLDKDLEWKDLPGDKLLKKAIHENAADELQKESNK